MKVYSFSLQGKRPTQEDQHITNININNKSSQYNNINLIGVFDGHGGKTVSYYLKKNLAPLFLIKTNHNHNIFLKNYLSKICLIYLCFLKIYQLFLLLHRIYILYFYSNILGKVNY